LMPRGKSWPLRPQIGYFLKKWGGSTRTGMNGFRSSGHFSGGRGCKTTKKKNGIPARRRQTALPHGRGHASTIFRRTAVANFDERLGVYLHELIADIATPEVDSRVAPGQLGEPQFELPLSGWYWQITRLDVPKPEIRASRSLFAAKLPRLSESGVAAGAGGARRGFAKGPDDRVLRMVERIIDTGDQGIYLIQIAATTEESTRKSLVSNLTWS
jgi:hypothetical protein